MVCSVCSFQGYKGTKIAINSLQLKELSLLKVKFDLISITGTQIDK